MNLSFNNEKNHVLRELRMEVNNLGLITSVSSNCYNILGYFDIEILNSNISELLKYNFTDLIAINNFQVEFLKKDKTTGCFDVSTYPLIDKNNKVTSVELSFFDISKYMDVEKKNHSFLRMLESARDIVFRFELKPEPRFTYLSPSIKSILGYTVDEHYKDPNLVFNLVHPDDQEIQKSKTNKNSDFTKTFCTRFRHRNGGYIWIEDYIIPTFENGELIAVEGISRNITERMQLEEKLKGLSYIDGLTGLYNRTFFNKQIQLLSEEIDIPVAAVVCDLDNLKYINDTLGHSAGDSLLENAGKLFNTIFNKNSIIFRNGGDEFIIIISNVSLKEGEELYSRMLSSIDEYNKKNKMPVQLSSGFAYASSSKTILELLSRADKNMYRNKYEKKQGTRR